MSSLYSLSTERFDAFGQGVFDSHQTCCRDRNDLCRQPEHPCLRQRYRDRRCDYYGPRSHSANSPNRPPLFAPAATVDPTFPA